MATLIDNPMSHLNAEQIEQIGHELDAIRDEVKASLGDRDRRYITNMSRCTTGSSSWPE